MYLCDVYTLYAIFIYRILDELSRVQRMLLSETFCELFNDPGMSFIKVNIKMTTTVGFFSSHGFLACTCHGFFKCRFSNQCIVKIFVTAIYYIENQVSFVIKKRRVTIDMAYLTNLKCVLYMNYELACLFCSAAAKSFWKFFFWLSSCKGMVDRTPFTISRVFPKYISYKVLRILFSIS